MDSAARLRGRLRAARHTLRELRASPEALVTTRCAGGVKCDICGGPIRRGRWVDRWLYADERDVTEQTVHPDCWEVLQTEDRSTWWEGDTIDGIICDWGSAELADAITGCVDPDCALYLRRVWESSRDGDDDE